MDGRSLRERFWAKVDRHEFDECWEWTGSTDGGGYGKVKSKGRTLRVHRVSWILHMGPIPDGLIVCHRCDNRLCVNPAHLFLGTDRDNARDRGEKDRTARGERHGSAKLTETEVLTIRRSYSLGIPQKQLAAEFGIDPRRVSDIVTRKKWAHV